MSLGVFFFLFLTHIVKNNVHPRRDDGHHCACTHAHMQAPKANTLAITSRIAISRAGTFALVLTSRLYELHV